jgi:hypothetical protein
MRLRLAVVECGGRRRRRSLEGEGQWGWGVGREKGEVQGAVELGVCCHVGVLGY